MDIFGIILPLIDIVCDNEIIIQYNQKNISSCDLAYNATNIAINNISIGYIFIFLAILVVAVIAVFGILFTRSRSQ